MRRILMSLAFGFLFVGGCAAGRGLTLAQAPPTPIMLYDAQPGWPTAAAMGRSTWPSTTSFQAQSEEIFYTERFIDVQRAGPFSGRNHDFVYRRFSTRRVGRARR